MIGSISDWLRDLPRLWKRVLMISFDIATVGFALWASFSLRYSVWMVPNSLDQWVILLTAPIVAIPIFAKMGLYRAVIRYLPERALWTIVQATILATVCWVVVVFLSEMAGRGVVPRSVPPLYFIISTTLVAGSRFLAKRLLWASDGNGLKHRQIVIYGAGEAGAQLANALRRQGTERVVAFIDDNPALRGRDVAGIRVYQPAYLETLVRQHGVEEVILTIPSLSAKRRQEILAKIGACGAKIRTLPPISDLVRGKYLVGQVREIDIDELLGRSAVPPDMQLIHQMIDGKTIMVTGAGGSIGSELCRLIVRSAPQRLILLEANEFALYQIERELIARKDVAIVPVLASVADEAAMKRTMQHYGVQVVFHAAAHKHVPLVEANVLEGIRNNVLGTLTVARTALESGVDSFVLISSDKAVRPTNVMGATKRWAELIVTLLAERAARAGKGQRFCAVRFGNVLGSNGSVVPLFKEQIAHGGPVTLTDPAMTRYFMSIHEASELIVQAGALSEGGDVFLLDMGEPMLILDLAKNMIRLAGFAVRSDKGHDGDIEIVVTGKRSGEKMFEELFYDDSNAVTTRHPKIMRAVQGMDNNSRVEVVLAELSAALEAQDEAQARRILFEFVNETA